MSKTKKRFNKNDKNLSQVVSCKFCGTKTFADEATISEFGIFCSDLCAIAFEERDKR